MIWAYHQRNFAYQELQKTSSQQGCRVRATWMLVTCAENTHLMNFIQTHATIFHFLYSFPHFISFISFTFELLLLFL